MNLQESGEMYLETIYLLTKEKPHVRAIDISEYMGFSKPSVSRAIGLLRNGGYITVDADGHITLTDAGCEISSKIYRRHRVLTRLLMHIGVAEDVAAEEACKLEHAISDSTLDKLKAYMDKAEA